MRTVRSIPRLPRRRRDAHKGDVGRVLIVGGSRGMIGAPALAANAALRGGAGLVTLAVPEAVQLAVACLCPCATSVPLACEPSGEPAAAAVRQMLDAAGAADVLAVGPGMGASAGAAALVRAALEQDKPLVLDADGLNNLARIDRWTDLRRCRLVLTPHPGEFSRLTGQAVQDIQADRLAAAAAAARQWAAGPTAAAQAPAGIGPAPAAGGTGASSPLKKTGCCVVGVSPAPNRLGFRWSAGAGGTPATRSQRAADGSRGRRRGRPGDGPPEAPLVVVLKGAGTVVTDGRRAYVNHTGNPGMATGGAGDVLTGLVAAFIGQHLAAFDAACLAVRVHGLAGDLAAERLGQVSLIASDLIDFLPAALRQL